MVSKSKMFEKPFNLIKSLPSREMKSSVEDEINSFGGVIGLETLLSESRLLLFNDSDKFEFPAKTLGFDFPDFLEVGKEADFSLVVIKTSWLLLSSLAKLLKSEFVAVFVAVLAILEATAGTAG